MDTSPPPHVPWNAVGTDLLDLAALDLEHGHDPRPTLAAYSGDEPIAMVELRPFSSGEALQALIEVLALLLPLGADRLAFAAPARVWSLEDPIPPVCEDGDLRQRAIMLVTADAHDQPCVLKGYVHPFSLGTGGASWGPAMQPDETLESPVATALTALLDARDDLDDLGDGRRLAAQFGRVLLLGHGMALAPDCAERLTAATAS